MYEKFSSNFGGQKLTSEYCLNSNDYSPTKPANCLFWHLFNAMIVWNPKILATMHTSSLDLCKVRSWKKNGKKKWSNLCVFLDSWSINYLFPELWPQVLYIFGNVILWQIIKYNGKFPADYQ